ncbi:translocation/assembly module TamB domain-containing protein [bacterium]|nr:translocation/assembly module TamB domain-containing protein [bacterium]
MQARSAFASIPYSSFWAKEFLVEQVIVDSPKIDLEFILSLKGSANTIEKAFRIEKATIREGEAQFKKYQVQQIELESQIDSEQIQIRKLKSKFKNIGLRADGTLKKAGVNISYGIDGDAAEIASMIPEAREFKGHFVTKGSIKGEPQKPIISGQLECKNAILHDSNPFSVVGQYRYDLENEIEPISLELNFDSVPLGIIRNYRKEIPQLDSIGRGSIKYYGTKDFWKAKGKIAFQIESTAEAKHPLTGELYGHFQNGLLQIDSSKFILGNSRLIADGTLSRDQLSINTEFQTSNLKDVAFLDPRVAYVRGDYRGQAKITGFYKDINVQGDITGQSGSSMVKASGNTRLGNRTISVVFDGNIDSQLLNKLLPDVTDGEIHFGGSIDGTWKKPAINATWNAAKFQIRTMRFQELSGEVKTVGETMQIHAVSPDLLLQADGSYQLNSGSFQLKGNVDGTPIEPFLVAFDEEQIPISGKVQGNFEASGNIHRWRESTGRMVLHVPEIQMKDLVISVPDTELQLENRVVHLKTRAESPNIHLDVFGTASLQPNIPLQIQINGKVDGAVLEKISTDWKGEGELNLDATLTGTASRPKLQGKLHAENFMMNNGPDRWNVVLHKTEVNLSEQTVNLEGNGQLNNSPFLFKGNIPLENADGNIHFEISNFLLSTFKTGANVSGSLNVNADLQGKGFPLREWKTMKMPFREWSGNISVSPSNLKVGDNVLTVEQPIALTIQNQEIHLPLTRIQSGDLLKFEGSGNLNLTTGKLDSSVQLEAKVDLLSSLRTDIQSSGPLKADVRVSGTLQKPEIEGTVEMKRVSLRIPESPLSIEELDLQASLKNKRLQLQTLKARSGGGTITGGGELILGEKGSEVWVQGRNVASNFPEGLSSQVDFDLKLSSLESSEVLLSGDIKVLRSLYERQFNLRHPMVKKLLATSPEPITKRRLKNRVNLAVNISTVNDLRFKNDFANFTGGGNLKVEGNLYRPRLTGALNVRPGSRVYLAGNQYDVEKATVEFFGGEFLEPNLDVTLYSLQRDFETDNYYEVFLPFGGPLSNIEFKNVRSVPSLSQDQIFSLITEGTVESHQVLSARAVFQQQILSTVAGQVLAAPGTVVAKSIGLSRIQVQQEGLTSVNDPKTRLMVGKDIGAGFSLIYSFVLNDPQDQTWIASYRYGRNILGRFIDQDDGTYTISASHRIPFGKGANPSSAYFDARKKERKPRITSVQIKNDSPLTEKQIEDILEVEVGKEYDYWVLQERVDELKKELQKEDFLYSSVEVREKENQNGAVSLDIEVQTAEQAQMIFTGYEIGGKLLKNYKRMWRTGISPIVVQQMIQEDLLQQIQLTGCYKASVKLRTEKKDPYTIYYFDVDPGPKFSTVKLMFHGADHYDPEILQADLVREYNFSPASLFREAIQKPSDFSEKIKMLYIQKGYLRTVAEPGRVEYSSDSGEIVRTIDLNEGPISYVDTVTTLKGKPIPDPLEKQIQLASGKTFIPDALMNDEKKIHDYYESQGYQNVSVRYNVEFRKGSSNIQIRWAVDVGPIARIASVRVEGNQSTRTDLILKQTGLKVGDLLTQDNQSLARKRLSDLGIFQQVGIETEEADVAGSYDVVISVVENKKYEFQYGGRYNTDDNFGAEIRLTDFNFLGRAQNLSLYLRSTLDLPLFRVDYMLPVLGNFWDRMRFSIFRDETDEEVRATVSGDLKRVPFSKKQFTFQYQQDRKLWDFFRLLWGFQYGSVTANFEDLQTRVPLEFSGREALFHGAFIGDRRDDSLNATTGYFYSVDGEYAPKLFGSDISYAKTFSQFFYYKKIGRIVSASGIRIGFLAIRSNILSISEKFRTGGSASIRGFEYNTVIPGDDVISVFFGGDSVLILNEELRFPIYKLVSGATFIDIGNVYRQVSDFDPTDLRYSAGFGMRVGKGSFVLRFDFGFNLDPEEDEPGAVFHFGIGQAF